MTNTPFHVEYLRQELLRRQARNPRYSMRSYARYLGMDASSLSRIFKGKQQLSVSLGQRIIQRLGLSNQDRDRFVAAIADARRKKALRALAGFHDLVETQQDGDFERLFAAAPEAILVLDPRSRVVLEVNPAACKLCGLQREELVGQSILSSFPEFAAAAPSRFRAAIRSSNGTALGLDVSASPVDFRGEAAMIAIARSIADDAVALSA